MQAMSLHSNNIRHIATHPRVISHLALLLIFFLFSPPSLAADTLFKGSSLPINGSLVSNGGIFKLSFFRTNPNGGYYLGISYNTISINTIIWVANRETPVDEKGSLRIVFNGNLNLISGKGDILWSSNATLDYSNCSAQIRDNGNLVLSSDEAILWQSFDHPTDTLLPGMKLTSNLSSGETLKLVSWKTPEDPAPGRFSLSLDPRGSDQIFIYNGSDIWWRSGKWNKKSFIGITRMRALSIYGFSLEIQDNQKLVLSFNYYSPFLRFVMQWNGIQNTSQWTPDNRSWTEVWLQPLTDCERYNFCGSYSLCDEGLSPKCRCLQGFNLTSEGFCVRRNSLQCEGGYGYARMERVKLPDFAVWVSSATDENSCLLFCSSNCSCKAFSYVEDVGCLIWTVDLVDQAQLPTDGNTMFLKLDSRDLDSGGGGNIKKVLAITLPIALGVILLMCIFCGWKYKAMIKGGKIKSEVAAGNSETPSGLFGDKHIQSFQGSSGQREDSVDLPLYSFDAIATATNNFSEDRKLGQGGFGVVYKGVLPGGEEIAVKRLSRTSCQGQDEFKNEVIVIANLQHRNLVRLLGCCFQEDEKILVYEYMANKSLDSLLFDMEGKLRLDWRKRLGIIEGVARGLLYLHRDSRLKIVHRDLKASNILLDEEMSPKISDFGMARIFGGNQNHENTTRVVGTFGYMSPEYAMEGIFSEKTDVYSFGVLVLEILSGRKNARTRSENYSSLLGYAWQLWTEERPEDLIDPCIRESCDVSQAIRCIHIGLLCVQNHIRDRPTMSAVVILLSSQNPIEGSPQQPTFVLDSSLNNTVIRNLNEDHFSTNEVTISVLTAR